MAKFQVKKTWDHNLGLSVAFRQHPAVETHCRFVHGYPLAITAVFESETLDHRNWVISFGELKPVLEFLKDLLDHKTLVAADDPHLGWFLRAEELGIMQVKIVGKVGCEAVAELIYDNVIRLLGDKMKANNVSLMSIEVREHAGNSATYFGDVTPKEFKQPWDATRAAEFTVGQITARGIPGTVVYNDDGSLSATASASSSLRSSDMTASYVKIPHPFASVSVDSRITEGGLRDIPSLTIKAADLRKDESKLAAYTVKADPNYEVTDLRLTAFNYGNTAIVPALTENI